MILFEDLISKGIEIRDSIKPTELTDDNFFIYDFEDIDSFNIWKQAVIDSVDNDEIALLLNGAKKGISLPVHIGRVLAILYKLSGNINTEVSPLAPRSTDF